MAVDIRVPVLVQDPVASGERSLPRMEWVRLRGEDVVLDGPVSPRVAVLDLDAITGRLKRGARYQPPVRDGEPGTFRLQDPERLDAADVIQVSVFGAVLRTLEMFEEDDALGRRVRWAFEGSQLLVVPRAGEWANAFYQRESRSLQFFSFRHRLPNGREERIYTCQSQDIIAHETAHAVLDGIAPDLYHALSPQAVALHEAVADLTAALAAFRCRPLVRQVLKEQGGSIARSGAFSAIGEQFGKALGHEKGHLRDLHNEKTLRPIEGGRPEDVVTSVEPHALSEVLSGALYGVMLRLHEALKDEFALKPQARTSLVAPAETARHALPPEDAPEPPLEYRDYVSDEAWQEARRRMSGKALAVAASRFKRSLYRGLDYLPPGEVSFADLGRAILAADQASHPDSGEQRTWLCQEFVRRGIVRHERELRVRTDFEHRALDGVDMDTLVKSDWAAYAFANRHRGFLRIPRGVSFHIAPRLVVEKLYYGATGGQRTRRIRECLFKVSWKVDEPDTLPGSGLPEWRQVTFGTTLAIDCETRRVRVLLTSDRHLTRKADRDGMVRWLMEEDLLRVGEDALGPDGRPLCGTIRGEVSDGILRVVGTAHMLHLTEQRRFARGGG
ncbi:hypothetical protein HPC49_10350 [Pyxidicoccus fallax]|uniref:Uncharacterized protein n=1 Tax=Pyxidicoccus fallax TaxID=394095 RepID=A0A848LIX0_9BACT|nr:hypothetical protein [Pyxidicoccus fallax]NMO17669.1 hypothetical protein [Pyxidicoccus fallax]NPC78643.1 hypothetical protein [Pyxidicoccus fallax]